MGLRDFFKSKNGGLKLDPQLRWFGKLPSYADYYRAPGDEAWTVELGDWMLKGFELYCGRQSGEGMKPERLVTAACILRLPESQMTALAAFFDFGGDARGRPFPICFYVGIPTEAYPGPDNDSIVVALKVLGDLLALRRDVELFAASASSIDEVFGARTVDLSAFASAPDGVLLWEGAGDVEWSDWFAGVRPRLRVQTQDRWLGLVESFGRNLVANESKAFSPTVSFPLAGQTPLEIQVAGWVRWLGERLDLSRRSFSLMVSGDLEIGPGSLTAVMRELTPEDFLLLTSQASSLPYLDSLERMGGSEGGVESLCGVGEESPPPSWRAFMESRPGPT